MQIGFFSILGLIFIVLKLVGTIAWSWWWVLAPFWGPLVLFLIILLATGVLVVIFPSAFTSKRRKPWGDLR